MEPCRNSLDAVVVKELGCLRGPLATQLMSVGRIIILWLLHVRLFSSLKMTGKIVEVFIPGETFIAVELQWRIAHFPVLLCYSR